MKEKSENKTTEKKKVKRKNTRQLHRIVDSRLRDRNCPEIATVDQPGWCLFTGSTKACHTWIMEGLAGTEGAERDHYVSLLFQLESGLDELDYNAVY